MVGSVSVNFRAEVVGSLLRSDYLKLAFERAERGEISADELGGVQDRAALEAIALQEESGVDVVTDGEVRRKAWFDPLTESLGYSTDVSAPVPFIAGQGKQTHDPPKLPVPVSRLGSVLYLPEVSSAAYPSRDEYVSGIASTMPGNVVTVDDQRPKLELVSRVARDVWG